MAESRAVPAKSMRKLMRNSSGIHAEFMPIRCRNPAAASCRIRTKENRADAARIAPRISSDARRRRAR
ncbi:hypothetical protein, partial [Burkholderia pseudomallei]